MHGLLVQLLEHDKLAAVANAQAAVSAPLGGYAGCIAVRDVEPGLERKVVEPRRVLEAVEQLGRVPTATHGVEGVEETRLSPPVDEDGEAAVGEARNGVESARLARRISRSVGLGVECCPGLDGCEPAQRIVL